MFFEPLENRTLFSVVPHDPQVVADRLHVDAALLKFQADAISCTATLLIDAAAIKAHYTPSELALEPLVKTLGTDVQAMWNQLYADNLSESKAVIKDDSNIVAELEKIVKDHGNVAALKTDHATLLADRVQLEKDEIAGLDARIATRTADYTKIFADITNITTAAGKDKNLTSTQKAEINKFASDGTICLNKMLADLKTIAADRTKLMNDLIAEEA
jgi:hypothetical protein